MYLCNWHIYNHESSSDVVLESREEYYKTLIFFSHPARRPNMKQMAKLACRIIATRQSFYLQLTNDLAQFITTRKTQLSSHGKRQRSDHYVVGRYGALGLGK